MIIWPPLVNVSKHAQPTKVSLHDGREVDSDSEDWREECEARQVLRMPGRQDRLNYLEGVGKRRGKDCRKALERVIWIIWQARRSSAGTE